MRALRTLRIFSAVTVWEAAAWGAAGGFVVEALFYMAALRAGPGLPWSREGEPGVWPSLLAFALRIAVGTVVAAAAGASGHLTTPLFALYIGAATPTFLPTILKNIGALAAPSVNQPDPQLAASAANSTPPDSATALPAEEQTNA